MTVGLLSPALMACWEVENGQFTGALACPQDHRDEAVSTLTSSRALAFDRSCWLRRIAKL